MEAQKSPVGVKKRHKRHKRHDSHGSGLQSQLIHDASQIYPSWEASCSGEKRHGKRHAPEKRHGKRHAKNRIPSGFAGIGDANDTCDAFFGPCVILLGVTV